MSGKNTNRYRCYYFLKVHKDSWNGYFDFTATNDERAKKHAKAYIRARNKWNEKLIKHSDREIASFQHVSRISIELVEKETLI